VITEEDVVTDTNRLPGLPPLQEMDTTERVLVREVVRLRQAVAELTVGLNNLATFAMNALDTTFPGPDMVREKATRETLLGVRRLALHVSDTLTPPTQKDETL